MAGKDCKPEVTPTSPEMKFKAAKGNLKERDYSYTTQEYYALTIQGNLKQLSAVN